jgi:hypothetical protein
MRLAAIGDDGVWIEGQPHPRPLGGGDLRAAEIFNRMQHNGVKVLYVHPSGLELLGLPSQIQHALPGAGRPAHKWLEGPLPLGGKPISTRSLAPSIECGDMEILIGAYQGGSGSPFDLADDAQELLEAALAFRDAFERPWTFRNSAMMTGWHLMTAPWKDTTQRGRRLAAHRDWHTNERPLLAGVEPGTQIEQPLGAWARAKSKRPRKLPYVVGWDVNAQRLAASARLSVGVGGLEHRPAGGVTPPSERLIDTKLPGYHLITKIKHPHKGLIPPLMEPGWHTTPRVAMAHYLGIEIDVKESWVWNEHVPFFNPWYEQMRDARARLMDNSLPEDKGDQLGRRNPAKEIALMALKQAYLEPFGRLRSERSRTTGSIYYRPDWYDAVIGNEVAREYLRLHQLAELGEQVLAVYFDTIIIETDEPTNPPTPIQLSTQLGKYKPVGEVLPANLAREYLYRDGGRNVAALKKRMEERPWLPTIEAVRLEINGKDETAAFLQGRHPGFEHARAIQRPVHGGYPDA